ncbi:TIM barrel protein [Oceanobacillus polygoni]|uniref:Sugar phosphate isomerase/epimerase n=1 Tax=Oceanobacillus polygoni TaxID=1235259 RepID=A0A9X0YX53_9BACI|nr:TIM barrel protein [Oceanobacillus polygoni]MBP2078779.1 sugar phosphate isomerase/epimerase [Oceanobacillus polygoni]
MHHHIGLSGSTIMTDPEKFPLLFNKDNVSHIEIGEFPSKASFHNFVELLDKENVTFGLHSPLYRNQSKYDLLEKVNYEPEQAWRQFESEVKYMSQLGAAYILVHFPYFKEEKDIDTTEIIEDGLKKLYQLQERYSIPIVCEPKLGLNRSAFGIKALDDFPMEIWEKYGIKLCIDIGDYLLATGDEAVGYIDKWKKHIKVVHLHNVEFYNDKYIWVPVHPSQENDNSHFKVRDLIYKLSTNPGVFFIFEHTPHTNPTDTFVNEGINWVKDIIGGG